MWSTQLNVVIRFSLRAPRLFFIHFLAELLRNYAHLYSFIYQKYNVVHTRTHLFTHSRNFGKLKTPTVRRP